MNRPFCSGSSAKTPWPFPGDSRTEIFGIRPFWTSRFSQNSGEHSHFVWHSTIGTSKSTNFPSQYAAPKMRTRAMRRFAIWFWGRFAIWFRRRIAIWFRGRIAIWFRRRIAMWFRGIVGWTMATGHFAAEIAPRAEHWRSDRFVFHPSAGKKNGIYYWIHKIIKNIIANQFNIGVIQDKFIPKFCIKSNQCQNLISKKLKII